MVCVRIDNKWAKAQGCEVSHGHRRRRYSQDLGTPGGGSTLTLHLLTAVRKRRLGLLRARVRH
jgi:hypothetical protein